VEYIKKKEYLGVTVSGVGFKELVMYFKEKGIKKFIHGY